MNPFIEFNLALILFLPWYALLGWVYWRVTAQGAKAITKAVAVLTLVVALAAAAGAGLWAYHFADPEFGAMWKQVLSCVAGYGAFLGVLGIGFGLQRPRARHSLAREGANSLVEKRVVMRPSIKVR